MTILTFLLVTMVIGAATAIHSAVGFGMALMANPILLLINPRFVPAPMLMAAFFISILVVLRERAALDMGGLRWAVAGRLVGAALAAWLLLRIAQEDLVLVFCIFVLAAVLMSVLGLRMKVKPSSLLFAGVLAGLMGTIASIGGPPMALLYQDSDGARFRSTLSGFFIVGVLLSMGTLALIGRFGFQDLVLGLVLLPGSLAGYLISSRVLHWVSPKVLRISVWSISSIMALVVIIQEIF